MQGVGQEAVGCEASIGSKGFTPKKRHVIHQVANEKKWVLYLSCKQFWWPILVLMFRVFVALQVAISFMNLSKTSIHASGKLISNFSRNLHQDD